MHFADPLRRLAEHLKVADDCVLKGSRGEDGTPAGGGILGDSANALEDMFQIRALGFHTGTASRSTASRISGLNGPQQFASLAEGNYPLTIAVNGVSSPAAINSDLPRPLVLPIQH